jgi:hypothetical protein
MNIEKFRSFATKLKRRPVATTLHRPADKKTPARDFDQRDRQAGITIVTMRSVSCA